MHGAPAWGPGFRQPTYANPAAPKGGQLVQGVLGTFDSLNPFIVRGLPAVNLRSYVVARINPVRFHKMKAGDKKPAMPIAQALLKMFASAKKFDLSRVNMSDLAFVAAGAESGE